MVSSPKKSLQQVIWEMGREQEEKLQNHPDIEDLLYYLEASLPAEKADRVQEHLAYCRSCADALLELEAPLGFETKALGVSKTNTPKKSLLGIRMEWALAAAAAMVFFAGFSLGPYFLSTADPWVNPQVHSLEPIGSSSLRGENELIDPSVTAGHQPILLYLNLLQDKVYTSYSVILIDETGRPIWENREMKPDRGGRFAMILPSDFLSPGSYRVTLFGLSQGETVTLGEYTFDIGGD